MLQCVIRASLKADRWPVVHINHKALIRAPVPEHLGCSQP